MIYGVYVPDEYEKPLEALIDVFSKDWQQKVKNDLENGDCYVSLPFFDPQLVNPDPFSLDMFYTISGVKEDHGAGDINFRVRLPSFDHEVLEHIKDDPEFYASKASIMSASLRALADKIDAIANGIS